MAGKTKAEKEKLKQKQLELAAELERKKEIHDEVFSIILIAFGVFLALSLHTSAMGAVGGFVKNVLGGVFGRIAFVLPYYLIVYGVLNFAQKTSFISARSVICLIILFLCINVVSAAISPALGTNIKTIAFKEEFAKGTSGLGVVGLFLGTLLNKLAGKVGLYIICICVALIMMMFIINTPLSVFFDDLKIKAKAKRQAREEDRLEREKQQAADDAVLAAELKRQEEERIREAAKKAVKIDDEPIVIKPENIIEQPVLNMPDFEIETEPEHKFIPEDIGLRSIAADNKQQILDYVTDENLFARSGNSTGLGLDGEDRSFKQAPDTGNSVLNTGDTSQTAARPAGKKTVSKGYKFPPLTLLSKGKNEKESAGFSEKEQAAALENALKSFGVNATVLNITKGPAVTRYELQPATGVRVNSITKLHDDLQLVLKAKSLRIEAPIPGKSAVGIEVSNDAQKTVCLRDVLASKEFTQAKSKISMGLGMSINGDPVVANLKDMPHLLIAGSTGSGKSVCINSIVMSMLYKATPQDVKMIMIDPKVVELSVYNGIPHLLVPVVTEPGKAAAALGWACTEMDERYNKFSAECVRNLEGYNETVEANGEPEKKMPQIVIILDEMADLMAVAQNQVEGYIARLASKARAAGIHLIVATQRPSTEVVTGTIKNNIPSRIAFAVGSQVDSRVILDEGGAEHLLGKGDMLYLPQGMNKPIRVQGCFVSDEEVTSVIEYVKANSEQSEYNADVQDALNNTGNKNSSSNDPDEDELLTEVIEFVVRAEQASTSAIQRRFRVGYNRAARLIDIMEERGIIGPPETGAKSRKVLMSVAEFEALESQAVEVPEEIDQ